jgi:SSS family solute:Na+ symporter
VALQPLDWTLVLIPLVVVVWIAVKTQRHVKSVADFLAAGRAGGRYLVANATGEIGMGAITIVGVFEVYYASGFSMGWWKQATMPIGLVITLTGYVIYRYRQSRVMTLAQFFERRYSKNFRIFMGIMAWISGTLNYGLFPIVATRFFIYYCDFPQYFHIGATPVLTEAAMMLVLLGSALIFTLVGGQLTVMVADCMEGIISNIMYLIVCAVLLTTFPWSQIASTMADTPPTKSLLNPFDTMGIKDFNIWYVLIGVAGMFYNVISWQGGHAFRASAASPHEAKMGNILAQWRGQARGVMFLVLAVCAYTYLHNPQYHDGAQWVNNAVARIHDKETMRQMRVPLALSHFLPAGIKGLFAAIVLFAMLACDSSYLHSWGSIFAQDVVLPFRKTHLTPEAHIRLLRFSILFIAVFAYFFGLSYRQTDYLLMYQVLTATIFTGGAGAAIVGGFYWRKGTTAGAYAGMITGSALACAGAIVQQFAHAPGVIAYMGPRVTNAWDQIHGLNGAWVSFFAMIAAVITYVGVSLLTCRQEFDLDRALHRGKWAVDESGNPLPPVPKPPRSWKAILGIDPNFTRGDKVISISLFTWSMSFFAVFIIVSVWQVFWRWPTQWWTNYWYIVGILIPLGVTFITTVWFTIGGIHDIRRLFRTLAQTGRNELDDGTVRTDDAKVEAEDEARV